MGEGNFGNKWRGGDNGSTNPGQIMPDPSFPAPVPPVSAPTPTEPAAAGPVESPTPKGFNAPSPLPIGVKFPDETFRDALRPVADDIKTSTPVYPPNSVVFPGRTQQPHSPYSEIAQPPVEETQPQPEEPTSWVSRLWRRMTG